MRNTSVSELDDEIIRSMSIGALFSDFVGKINALDFHRTADLLVTSGEDDFVRLYDIANGKLLKTTHHKKHGADRICFTHHPSSVICSSTHNLDSGAESLRYLSMYDNRCLRYFKGHKERVVSLCTSPVDDSFMSGSLDHTVRIWDLRVNACQGILRLRGRPTVAYDQQGLVFAVSMEGGAIKLFDSRGDMAEIWDIKFSNDGKSMLLTTKSNNIYVLDAYNGEKRCGFSSGDGTLNAWSIPTRSKNVPEVRNPATARPTVSAAGIITGLKITNTGVAKASPIMVPARVIPASPSKIPPTGNKAITVKIFPLDGPCERMRDLAPP
ncbi:WD40 repeat-containing protein, partial [Cynara cardunculus var. scolymus]